LYGYAPERGRPLSELVYTIHDSTQDNSVFDHVAETLALLVVSKFTEKSL